MSVALGEETHFPNLRRLHRPTRRRIPRRFTPLAVRRLLILRKSMSHSRAGAFPFPMGVVNAAAR